MNTPARFVYASLGVALLLPAPASARAQDMADVQIVAHPVAGSVYYLEGRGGNIVLTTGEDGVVMVDDQFAPLTDRILDAVGELSDGEIRFVINTHVHPDHTGGNENLGRMGVLILARDEVRVRLAEQSPADALPVLTYSDAITIHLNGDEVHVAPLPPAHTDGDSYIHFLGQDVIAVGDVFRTTEFPRIDRGNGGTLDGTIEALAVLAGIGGPDTRYVPGHGVVSSREDIVTFRDMVVDIARRAGAMVADGATLEEVLAADLAAAYVADWGDPERFLTEVYSELTNAP